MPHDISVGRKFILKLWENNSIECLQIIEGWNHLIRKFSSTIRLQDKCSYDRNL